MSDQEQQSIVAAGLQKQLDELRTVIQLGLGSDSSSKDSSKDSSDSQDSKCDAATIVRLESENQKLQVRIQHLLRALDSKDQAIRELQARHA
ncbi:hypothetical protein GGI12_000397 [Dipsacomyces acuminosporus]|nr:hypothetical protein GGI12_000397 [Dipsacomyces acuminosporus]